MYVCAVPARIPLEHCAYIVCQLLFCAIDVDSVLRAVACWLLRCMSGRAVQKRQAMVHSVGLARQPRT